MDPQRPPHEQIVFPALLRHARGTYGAAMRAALEAAGYDDIPGNGLYLIGGLALGDGEVPLAELIRQMRISKQAAGQLVDTLVNRGYLQRTVDPQDRRKLIVSLTERGRAAAMIQGEARDRIDAALLARVGPQAVQTARQVLAALIGMGRDDAGG